jgi:hypothetical protein
VPESLTRRMRRETCAPLWGGRHRLGTVAGFSSEWWPVSNRNPGRLHLGIPGRNASCNHPGLAPSRVFAVQHTSNEFSLPVLSSLHSLIQGVFQQELYY